MFSGTLGSKKLLEATVEGQHVATGTKTLSKFSKKNFCINCGERAENLEEKLFSCQQCDSGQYCSETCLQAHENHSKYCALICSVQQIETTKQLSKGICITDSEKLPRKLKRKLISLVGPKPLVKVFLGNMHIEGLWDTGAMVSILSRAFLEENFTGVQVRPVSDFIEHEVLKINTANQAELAIDGVVVLDFGVEEGDPLFQVPFLVTADTLSRPIIGYNTIEYFVLNFGHSVDMPTSMSKVVSDLAPRLADDVINVITAGGKITEISNITRDRVQAVL